MGEPSSFEYYLLQAVDSVKKQKQCPTILRIIQHFRTRVTEPKYSSFSEKDMQIALDNAVRNGTVRQVFNDRSKIFCYCRPIRSSSNKDKLRSNGKNEPVSDDDGDDGMSDSGEAIAHSHDVDGQHKLSEYDGTSEDDEGASNSTVAAAAMSHDNVDQCILTFLQTTIETHPQSTGLDCSSIESHILNSNIPYVNSSTSSPLLRESLQRLLEAGQITQAKGDSTNGPLYRLARQNHPPVMSALLAKPDSPRRSRQPRTLASLKLEIAPKQSPSKVDSKRKKLNNPPANLVLSSACPSEPSTPQRLKRRKRAKPITVCSFCMGDEFMNRKTNQKEDMVACATCGLCGHPSCLQWGPELVNRVQTMRWQCLQCKQCSICGGETKKGSEDLLFCDSCDRGFHLNCCKPPYKSPPPGDFFCGICQPRKSETPWVSILNEYVDEPDEIYKTLITAPSSAAQEIIEIKSDDNQVAPKAKSSPSGSNTTLKSLKRKNQKPPNSAPQTALPPKRSLVWKRKHSSLPRFSSKYFKRSSLSKKTRFISPQARELSGLSDHLSRYFTPSNLRQSRVSKLGRSFAGPDFVFDPTCVPRRAHQKVPDARAKPKETVKKPAIEETAQSVIPPKIEKRIVTRAASSIDVDEAHEAPKVLPTRKAKIKSEDMTLPEVAKSSSSQSPESPKKKVEKTEPTDFQLPLIPTRKVPKSLSMKKSPSKEQPKRCIKVEMITAPVADTVSEPEPVTETENVLIKRGRGRPRKVKSAENEDASVLPEVQESTTVDDGGGGGCDNVSPEVPKTKRPRKLAFKKIKRVPDELPIFDSIEEVNAVEDPMGVVSVLLIRQDDRDLFQQIQKSVQEKLQHVILGEPVPVEPSLPGDSKDSNVVPAPVASIRCPPRIQIGKYCVDTWYSAPYPSEYAQLDPLHICEFCLRYIKSRAVYLRHLDKCSQYCPPGHEIYRYNEVSVFEVDGHLNKLYCQNLCLLAKLFLDHKTLYYDVEPFMFYVATLSDEYGTHLVGYFSKEKSSSQRYNLSCIMVLPPYQKMKFGRFLIDFSYHLSRIEGEPGSPEKPLSDLGKLSYESYWRSKLLPYLIDALEVNEARAKNGDNNDTQQQLLPLGSLTLANISFETGIDPNDLAATLESLGQFTLGLDHKPTLVFNRDELLKLRQKYFDSKCQWVEVCADAIRWSPLATNNSPRHLPSAEAEKNDIVEDKTVNDKKPEVDTSLLSPNPGRKRLPVRQIRPVTRQKSETNKVPEKQEKLDSPPRLEDLSEPASQEFSLPDLTPKEERPSPKQEKRKNSSTNCRTAANNNMKRKRRSSSTDEDEGASGSKGPSRYNRSSKRASVQSAASSENTRSSNKSSQRKTSGQEKRHSTAPTSLQKESKSISLGSSKVGSVCHDDFPEDHDIEISCFNQDKAPDIFPSFHNTPLSSMDMGDIQNIPTLSPAVTLGAISEETNSDICEKIYRSAPMICRSETPDTLSMVGDSDSPVVLDTPDFVHLEDTNSEAEEAFKKFIRDPVSLLTVESMSTSYLSDYIVTTCKMSVIEDAATFRLTINKLVTHPPCVRSRLAKIDVKELENMSKCCEEDSTSEEDSDVKATFNCKERLEIVPTNVNKPSSSNQDNPMKIELSNTRIRQTDLSICYSSHYLEESSNDSGSLSSAFMKVATRMDIKENNSIVLSNITSSQSTPSAICNGNGEFLVQLVSEPIDTHSNISSDQDSQRQFSRTESINSVESDHADFDQQPGAPPPSQYEEEDVTLTAMNLPDEGMETDNFMEESKSHEEMTLNKSQSPNLTLLQDAPLTNYCSLSKGISTGNPVESIPSNHMHSSLPCLSVASPLSATNTNSIHSVYGAGSVCSPLSASVPSTMAPLSCNSAQLHSSHMHSKILSPSSTVSSLPQELISQQSTPQLVSGGAYSPSPDMHLARSSVPPVNVLETQTLSGPDPPATSHMSSVVHYGSYVMAMQELEKSRQLPAYLPPSHFYSYPSPYHYLPQSITSPDSTPNLFYPSPFPPRSPYFFPPNNVYPNYSLPYSGYLPPNPSSIAAHPLNPYNSEIEKQAILSAHHEAFVMAAKHAQGQAQNAALFSNSAVSRSLSSAIPPNVTHFMKH